MSIFSQDIVNFEMFLSHLTTDEQQHLMKLLPSVDTSDAPDRCACSFSPLAYKSPAWSHIILIGSSNYLIMGILYILCQIF